MINEHLPFQNGRQGDFSQYPTVDRHSFRLRPIQLGKFSIKLRLSYIVLQKKTSIIHIFKSSNIENNIVIFLWREDRKSMTDTEKRRAGLPRTAFALLAE